VDTILSYCRFNLLIDDMDAVLTPFCKEKNIGLINASGLHMGVLAEQGAPSWHPAPREIQELGRELTDWCRSRGTDDAKVAPRFCFDHPGVCSTLVGMSTPEHVKRNLELLQFENDPNLLKELNALITPVHNRIWPSGRGENQG
jgi:L-galactose dehydrogenase